LGAEDARLFSAYYDVTEDGNFEGENILHVSRSIADTAKAAGVSVERLNEALERGRRELFLCASNALSLRAMKRF
jgi:uncharacterized protein YyaL (SSP411 family)